MKKTTKLIGIAALIVIALAACTTGAGYDPALNEPEATASPREAEIEAPEPEEMEPEHEPEELEPEEPEPEVEEPEPEEPESNNQETPSCQNQGQNPPQGPGNSVETPPQAPVNLYPLLYRNLDEVRHVFGNEIYSGPSPIQYRRYEFDTGLRAIIDESGVILSIFLAYGQESNRTAYHFNGIDGTSTRDDVTAMFGAQPDGIRENSDQIQVGAVEDYGYWVGEGSFAWFSFDKDDRVVAISFFCVFLN